MSIELSDVIVQCDEERKVISYGTASFYVVNVSDLFI